MSIYRNSVLAFINLYESGLISPQEWEEFNRQTRNLLEDEKISEAIEDWLQAESRSQILQAYEERLETFPSAIDLDKSLGLAGSKSSTPPNQPSPSSRELLDNATKKNSSSDSQPSKQQP